MMKITFLLVDIIGNSLAKRKMKRIPHLPNESSSFGQILSIKQAERLLPVDISHLQCSLEAIHYLM
jgi:hypothetical protein